MRHGTVLRKCMMLWNDDYPHHKDVIHSQLYFKENNESEITALRCTGDADGFHTKECLETDEPSYSIKS